MPFCIGCMKETTYVKESTPTIIFARGAKIEYDEYKAYCPNCRRELYSPELHDLNCFNRAKAYDRIAKGE